MLDSPVLSMSEREKKPRAEKPATSPRVVRKDYEVPAVKRAMAILDSLNESAMGLSVQELSRIHKVPYSTAFYLLETMAKAGYVQRDDGSKKYSVGYKLLAFREGTAARNNLNLRALASPLMEELTEVTGLTCHLATLEKDEAVYIEKAEPAGYIRLNTWVGKRNSLHCSAVGKALLLHHSEADLKKVFRDAALPRRTDRTITRIDGLVEDLARCRERGYALDDGEDEIDGCCIAVPIFSAEQQLIAALGLSGTVNQIDQQRRERLAKLVKNYARQISARLGYVELRPEAGALKQAEATII
jgi:DNA-binding IclR family transcriptional regulator